MDLVANIGLGLGTALSATNLLYCTLGVVIGMVVGVIPGVGTMASMAMLFPLSFYMAPETALIMLAGIWYGTGYGGRTASILLNIPGTPANAVTCLDGYPMARQGRAGVALLLTTLASFVGGTFGIVLLMGFSPLIARWALAFGPAEYFALMALGLIAASAISEGSALKGLAMVVIGIIFGTIGADVYTGTPLYTFGMLELYEGIGLVPLAMGLFGVAEVISSIGRIKAGDIDKKSASFKAMKPTRDDLRRSWLPMARGSSVGAFFGTLPGTGPSVASFLSYALEKRISKTPERFGKGAVEGIMAPESADNSAEMTSFIPTLALGVPGSASMALMLGVLMIHGIQPGPSLINDQPQVFWGLVMSFWIGNIILVFLNIPLIGVWVRMLMVPYHLLYPAILAFVAIGTYTVSNSTFDIAVVLFFGALGWLLRVLHLPAAPLLLGFVLGPLMEEHFRRAMLFSKGSFGTFYDSGITKVVMTLSAILLIWSLVSAFRTMRKAKAAPTMATPDQIGQ
ncbi:tripartite tricarboxylate transporter permease [Devosia faecipullorum]|uniref:tripartite tricarboxylate transporter permease n=1 Tax=Devosia faecipullorum TaxID=2755039 RepID=UPI00187B883B|nr:tripartite tricarboxylate transporter permease [Devosia faecipullorum]MBE7733021.1 tripartite tricarboxylate transporter permease [Devosia faecipullorum]